MWVLEEPRGSIGAVGRNLSLLFLNELLLVEAFSWNNSVSVSFLGVMEQCDDGLIEALTKTRCIYIQ